MACPITEARGRQEQRLRGRPGGDCQKPLAALKGHSKPVLEITKLYQQHPIKFVLTDGDLKGAMHCDRHAQCPDISDGGVAAMIMMAVRGRDKETAGLITAQLGLSASKPSVSPSVSAFLAVPSNLPPDSGVAPAGPSLHVVPYCWRVPFSQSLSFSLPSTAWGILAVFVRQTYICILL